MTHHGSDACRSGQIPVAALPLGGAGGGAGGDYVMVASFHPQGEIHDLAFLLLGQRLPCKGKTSGLTVPSKQSGNQGDGARLGRYPCR